MKFTKMHGLGNDFVVINALEETLPDDMKKVAQEMGDRHFGVGYDQLLIVEKSSKADIQMIIYNQDGGRVGMCGNGIRAVAKYVYEKGIVQKETLSVETEFGIQTVTLHTKGEKVISVTVDMGEPILEGKKIPTAIEKEKVVEEGITVGDTSYDFTAVGMGNPHAVVFVDEITEEQVLHHGPLIEHNALFPERTNVHFVKVKSRNEMDLRVWERGAGETLACGSGACAVAVAGVLNNKTERKVTIHLKGGDLEIEWNENNHVLMTGPAELVFEGEWNGKTK